MRHSLLPVTAALLIILAGCSKAPKEVAGNIAIQPAGSTILEQASEAEEAQEQQTVQQKTTEKVLYLSVDEGRTIMPPVGWKDIVWSSDNRLVAVADGGELKALSPGCAIISAKASDGSIMRTTVYVTDESGDVIIAASSAFAAYTAPYDTSTIIADAKKYASTIGIAWNDELEKGNCDTTITDTGAFSYDEPALFKEYILSTLDYAKSSGKSQIKLSFRPSELAGRYEILTHVR